MGTAVPAVGGTTDPGFARVRDAFVANFEAGHEIGAACAVYVDGQKVVDLWGGVADPDSGRAWEHDTTAIVFSTTKGATAVCANLLDQRGDLDVDEAAATYWPEFAAAGKAGVTVRQLLCHQSGLPVIDSPLSFEDVVAWEPVIEALAAQAPMWEPGTEHGYHATTYGWLAGEVIRRASGRTVGQYFAEEVAGPLGLHFHIGLPVEHHPKVARLVGMGVVSGASGGGLGRGLDPELAALIEQFVGPDTLTGQALASPGGVLARDGGFNRPEVWSAEVPAANGISDARSVARLYAALVGEVDGVRILSAEQVAKATERQTRGPDKVIYFKTRFGLGFMLASVFSPFGSEASFGHSGLGGSVGFADPDHRIGFGYIPNRLDLNFSGDSRTRPLIEAVYAVIGVEPTFV